GADHAIRIVIPTGQYTPQFLVCDHPPADNAISPEPALEEVVTASLPEASPSTRPGVRKQLWVAVGLVAVVVIAGAGVHMRPVDPLDDFWRPVVSSPNPILLCFGNVEGAHRTRASAAAVEALTLLQYHGAA